MSDVSHDSETPAVGQQVITACAFIYQTFDEVEKVFLPKRADTKKFLPGIYELPGGHIDFGEGLEEGLKREIYEEFGMAVDVGYPFAAFTYTNHIKGSHSVEIIFLAQFTDSIDQIRLNPEDHSTYGWFAEHEVDAAYSMQKSAEDPEMRAVKRGFELRRLGLQ